MTAIVAYACPPRCNAGGTPEDGGHVFDADLELWRCRECGHEYAEKPGVRIGVATICPKCFVRAGVSFGGSLICRCGMSAMDWSLMTGP